MKWQECVSSWLKEHYSSSVNLLHAGTKSLNANETENGKYQSRTVKKTELQWNPDQGKRKLVSKIRKETTSVRSKNRGIEETQFYCSTV